MLALMTVRDWEFIGTIVAQLLVAAYVYGQLTQRQKDQGQRIEAQDQKINVIDVRLIQHEGRISHIEGRKNISHSAI